MSSQPGLYAAQRLVRSNLKLFLVLTSFSILGICVVTRPRFPIFNQSALSPYMSFASLILPGNTRFSMASIFASTGQSDLDFWLTDSTLFERLLERLRIREKIAAELQKRNPALVRFGDKVSITAFRTGSMQAAMPGDPSRNASVGTKYGISSQTFDDAPAASVSQYAQLESSEDDWEVHQNRLNRIAIRGMGLKAEDSKLVVDVTVRVLRAELEALAVRRVQKRKKSIQEFIAKGNSRVTRLYGKLGKQDAGAPQQAQKVTLQLSRLSKERLTANAELAALKHELARTSNSGPTIADDDLISQTVQAVERDLRQAEVLFLPSSSTVSRIRERLTGLKALAMQMHSERSHQIVADLQSRIANKEAALSNYQAEMRELKSRLPDPKQVISYRQLERELSTWDSQLLAWEQQLLQARIEERLCRGDGTAVILQGALPGVRPPIVTQQLFQQYRKTLTMLPLAPLAAVAGILIIQLVRGTRQIRSRAEYYFDAPVLAELPRLPKAYRQSWDSLKVQGRDLRTEKGLP